MTPFLLALAVPSSEELGKFVMNCLAVAGGFAIGYLLGAIGAHALDRWAFNRRSPDLVKQAIRVLSGIALALAIAFILFKGGSGGGWGGGSGPEGKGASGAATTSNGKTAEPAAKPPEVPPKPRDDPARPPDLPPDTATISVTFLAGDAVEGDRFYRVGDEASPQDMNLAELKKVILQRKESVKKPLTLVLRFPANPGQRPGPNTLTVTEVTSWAKNNGIGVYDPGK